MLIADLQAIGALCKRSRAGHLFAVYPRGIAEVALPEPLGFNLKMRTDERDLLRILGVLCDDLLEPAVAQLLEDVRSLLQIEWRHLSAAPGDLSVSSLRM